MKTIPGSIPEGTEVESLGNAVQGVGYGKHKYRGPKPPKFMKSPHYYPFYVYVLDAKLDLPSRSKKKDVETAMEGHIIQYGKITGAFGNQRSKFKGENPNEL